jgi:hypothetical protein
VNKEYAAQKAILADVEAGKLPLDELFAHGHELVRERMNPAALVGANA